MSVRVVPRSTIASSFRRKPESMVAEKWIPAFAGMTKSMSRACLVMLLVLSLTNCIGGYDRITGTTAYSGVGSSAGGIDAALVGRWTRTTLLDDNSGFLHTSQLIWEFNSDGGARRIIITTNLTLGLSTTEIVPALWRAAGGAVEITLLSSNGGSLHFLYSAGLSTLSLGPFLLERLP